MPLMSSNKQKQLIHIACGELNISREDRRNHLSEKYKHFKTGKPVTTSSDLTYAQAEDYLAELTKAGFRSKPAKKKSQYIKINVPDNRPGNYASANQLGMIAGMWVEKSREKTKASLQNFIKNVVDIKVDMLESLQKSDVKKVVKALANLK